MCVCVIRGKTQEKVVCQYLFHLVLPYEKPTSSDNHHVTEIKIMKIFFQWINFLPRLQTATGVWIRFLRLCCPARKTLGLGDSLYLETLTNKLISQPLCDSVFFFHFSFILFIIYYCIAQVNNALFFPPETRMYYSLSFSRVHCLLAECGNISVSLSRLQKKI